LADKDVSLPGNHDGSIAWLELAQAGKSASSTCLQKLLTVVVRRGEEKLAFAPWKLGLRTKISRKPEVSSKVSIRLLNCCNDGLFAGMTLTLHNTHHSCCSVC